MTPLRTPDAATEHRLEELRSEALRTGRVDATGIRPSGSPLPQATPENGYYGLPLLKEPTWTWEIPVYFFVGGAAGAAAVLGAAAQLTGTDPLLVRDARRIAAAGAVISAPLLIADLGRRDRFLNMLRVLKLQSPMSVGAWTLTVFGAASSAAVLADFLAWRTRLPARLIGDMAGVAAAASGLGMATYTGVLVGATVIPAWARHAAMLPIHFAASATGSAAALLELLGHQEPALNALALAAAGVETATGFYIESDRGIASEPLRRGSSGWTMRVAGILSGPLPMALRLFGRGSRRSRRAAAVSTLFGSIITRLAWVEAGKASARDSRTSLELAEPQQRSDAPLDRL